MTTFSFTGRGCGRQVIPRRRSLNFGNAGLQYPLQVRPGAVFHQQVLEAENQKSSCGTMNRARPDTQVAIQGRVFVSAGRVNAAKKIREGRDRFLDNVAGFVVMFAEKICGIAAKESALVR